MPIDIEARVHELVADPDRRRALAASCRERLACDVPSDDPAAALDLIWATFLACCPELVLAPGEAFAAIPAFVRGDLRGELGLMLVIPTLWARRRAGGEIQWAWRARDGHVTDVRSPERFFQQRVVWAALDERRAADRFVPPPLGANGTPGPIEMRIDARAAAPDCNDAGHAFARTLARTCRELFYREFVPHVRDLRFATQNGRPEFEYTVCELASRNVTLPDGCPPRRYAGFEPSGTLRVGGQKVLATRTRFLSLEIRTAPEAAPVACTLDRDRGCIIVATGPATLGGIEAALAAQLAGIVRTVTTSNPGAAVRPIAPTALGGPPDRLSPRPLAAGHARQTLTIVPKGLGLTIAVAQRATGFDSTFDVTQGQVVIQAATDSAGAPTTTWGTVASELTTRFAGFVESAESPRGDSVVAAVEAAPLDESEAARNQRQSRTRLRLLEALEDPAFMRSIPAELGRPHDGCREAFAWIVDCELSA